MVLYLLGIPLAIAGLKLLHDDVKYTAMDLRIDKASSEVNTQYKQIEKNFVDILRYSGAKCDIKKRGYDDYEIKNVQKGQYGGMERYLAEKGFYPEAIKHAKKLFDDIADKENNIKIQERDSRINKFERKLLTHSTKDNLITIRRNNYSPNWIVEQNVEKLIDYFNTHNNVVFCNIIMAEPRDYFNHKEVWHIKSPLDEDAEQYYYDVYDKVVNNNYSISASDDLYDLNRRQREINLKKYNDRKVRNNHHSTKNGLNSINNSQSKPNSSRRGNISDVQKTEVNNTTKMNPTLQHIVDEFKISGDINIVSKKIGIPAKKIKKWYNKNEGEYKLFHDAIADLNPNMKIKSIKELNSAPIDIQFNYVISSFKKYKNIKLVSEYTGISEKQIELWIKLGKSGFRPYTYFYDQISEFV